MKTSKGGIRAQPTPTSVMAPKDSYRPVAIAALWLASRTGQHEDARHAVDTLKREGWRSFPDPSDAINAICGELGVLAPLPGSALSEPLTTALEKVFYGESHACAVMARRGAVLRQQQIDSLLRLKLLPLYEWPSRIRTEDIAIGYIKDAELIALLMAGAHLPGMVTAPKEGVEEVPQSRLSPQPTEWKGRAVEIFLELRSNFPKASKSKLAEKTATKLNTERPGQRALTMENVLRNALSQVL